MARISKIQKEINDRQEMLEEKPTQTICSDAQILRLSCLVDELIERVGLLEDNASKKPTVRSINKVEVFNNEEESVPKETDKMKMQHEDKIQSMRNAIAILPPNMVDSEGKHLRENVQAICGFLVDQYMLDEAYEGIKIEPS